MGIKEEENEIPALIFGSVISNDGTSIGYRQMGNGPGVILLHGGLQSSQSFTKLAGLLSDKYTVYVPDRRGRGLSGPVGDNYNITRECDDIKALLLKTSAHYLFALSSGAVVSLQTALTSPSIYKMALYEPPLPIEGQHFPTKMLNRYTRELSQGKLAAAMITIMQATQSGLSFFTLLPRFIVTPVLSYLIEAEAKNNKTGEIPLKALIPTWQSDLRLVKDMEGKPFENFGTIKAEVLLLGGSKSPAYLKAALDALQKNFPNAKRTEIAGVDHLAADNTGKPELVVKELRQFFS